MKRLVMVFALLCLATGAAAQSRLVLIRTQQQLPAWADSRIYQKLALALTRQNGLEVEPAEALSPLESPFPTDYLDAAEVAAWAQPRNAQYVVIVIVQSERLEKRKTFNVPLIFHKYETFGVIEGELRVVDVAKGKLVLAKPFTVDQVGPRIFQATTDDDINDPDIHLTAPDKVRFLSHLEDKLVTWIMGEIKGPLGRYDREYVTRPQGHK